MRFALSAERLAFAASLHDLLAAADTPAVARGFAAGDYEPGRTLWKRLAELGVAALTVPERWGGLDAGPVDVVVAFEELGHHAVPGPVVESAAAAIVLAESGVTTWLTDLARGEVMASVALPPHVPYALDASVAAPVLAVEHDALSRVDATGGARSAAMSSVDPARRLFTVTGGEVLARGEEVRRAAAHAFELGALATAAQMLGAGRALLEMATGHAKARVQFGRPVGSFQAVKHRLADVYVALELARPLLFGAAIAVADRSEAAARDVSAAKVACAEAAYRAARAALQVHGAVGYTRECDLGLWLTKVRALMSAWGTGTVHRARVRAALAGREVRR
ncbi:MAG: acyl-CoA dehydrogenase [Streptosporangiales bacterium]|nr:acyl-CoA dehydrogenase [Streptosporangiales bacterium]